jgi:hypothetical protein
MRFLKSEKLDCLVRVMDAKLPEWERVLQRVEKLPSFNPSRVSHFARYLQWFSEAHLDLLVEQACLELEMPLNEELARPFMGYSFVRSNDGRVILRRDGRETEYDKIIMVGGVPVVFSISLGKSSDKIRKKRDVQSRLSVLCNSTNTETIGYVVVMGKDNYRELSRDLELKRKNPSLQIFKEGARPVALYGRRTEVADDIMKFVKEKIPGTEEILRMYERVTGRNIEVLETY